MGDMVVSIEGFSAVALPLPMAPLRNFMNGFFSGSVKDGTAAEGAVVVLGIGCGSCLDAGGGVGQEGYDETGAGVGAEKAVE